MAEIAFFTSHSLWLKKKSYFRLKFSGCLLYRGKFRPVRINFSWCELFPESTVAKQWQWFRGTSFLSRLTTLYSFDSIWQISYVVHDTRFCQYYSLNKFRFQVFIHTVQPMPDTCFIRYICQNRVSSAKISKLGNLLQVWLTHPRAGCHGRQLRSRQVQKYIIFVHYCTPQVHDSYRDANIWSTPPQPWITV